MSEANLQRGTWPRARPEKRWELSRPSGSSSFIVAAYFGDSQNRPRRVDLVPILRKGAPARRGVYRREQLAPSALWPKSTRDARCKPARTHRGTARSIRRQPDPAGPTITAGPAPQPAAGDPVPTVTFTVINNSTSAWWKFKPLTSPAPIPSVYTIEDMDNRRTDYPQRTVSARTPPGLGTPSPEADLASVWNNWKTASASTAKREPVIDRTYLPAGRWRLGDSGAGLRDRRQPALATYRPLSAANLCGDAGVPLVVCQPVLSGD